MSDIKFDYSELENKLTRAKCYKFSEVSDKLQKVAFDVVRFVDGENIEGLWQIKKTKDGELIVAMYEEPTLESKSSWSAIPDKAASNCTVWYKETPITRLAMANYPIPESDRAGFIAVLPSRLGKNPALVKSLLADLPSDKRQQILSTYPELGA